MSKPKSPKKKKARLSITKKQAEDYGLIATAYHESAHAIVALAHFFLIDDASISGHDGGQTVWYTRIEGTDDQKLRDMLVMAEIKTIYAGLVGERMYYRDICGSVKFPMHLRSGSSFDNSLCSRLIRRYNIVETGEPTSQLKQEIKIEIEKFLTRHWNSVKLVAHAIYKKRHLNFSELKHILIRSEDKDFWKDRFRKIQMLNNDRQNLPGLTVKNLISKK